MKGYKNGKEVLGQAQPKGQEQDSQRFTEGEGESSREVGREEVSEPGGQRMGQQEVGCWLIGEIENAQIKEMEKHIFRLRIALCAAVLVLLYIALWFS